ncbi:predicted protein [Chaetomium globosum CBS 148.51]|uniref:Uncharacterized protein n=1 Tax=Chaetomium globosum (strain ATCC 6205 / CBS 148.51 / DSM 1962 / NBRC 6347 / NRRL 1970) TaxID=306901 RepID=Q2H323_CHAGB|nr:uncharacterized protein CHGG_03823 [Chaetomium globosum CBS 148.51]EAQ87204.1 predicted protein [Chaetomium globosum CBS 148.51]
MTRSSSKRGDPDDPEMFRGLFRAGHESLLEYKPEVLLTICNADFVTDSVTMVQLFNVAGDVYRQMPRPTTALHLNLFVHVVHGKVFMKASGPRCGRFRTEATGHSVPPRFGLCDRMKEMNAQCFKRVTAYKLRTAGESVIPPYTIVIQDDNLMEAMKSEEQLDCVALRSCRHHGATINHAVQIVVQDNHGSLSNPSEAAICLSRFGADLSKGFWESSAAQVYPGALISWRQKQSGELWSLANLLQWIQTKAKRHASAHGSDTRFTVQVKATSCEQDGELLVPIYSLVTEAVSTDERLVSEKDVDTLSRWMTEPGFRYRPDESPPPYAPVAYPPPPYAN